MRQYDALMRTTVDIDEALLTEAKLAAARSGRRVSDLVAEGLRLLLSRQEAPTGPVDLPVFAGSGLQPGVDLEDREGLQALLDRD